ncbi:MAG: PAS domain S-box protein [Candidatus Riflebacteria bacterium]|nr:PAS domain S-box protein [Candidatus Riflebacteria bacterium]
MNLLNKQLIEEKLRESEAQLSTIGDNIPNGYIYQVTLAEDGTPTFLYVGRGVTEIHGFSPEEIIHDSARLYGQVDPDQVQTLFQSARDAHINGTDFSVEFRIHRPDGIWRWLHVRSRPRRRSDGLIVFDGVVLDITDRKDAEIARRASEASYRLLFDNMLNAVAHSRMIFRDGVPVDYEFIAVNPWFEKVTGMKDVVGRKISEIFPDYCHDNPDSLEVFGRVASTGEPAHWEHYLSAVDRWFLFAIYRCAPGEIIAVIDNITDRKRTEMQLRKLSSAIEQSPAEVVITDLLGNIEYVNPSVTKIAGYRPEECLGKNLRFLFGTEILTAEYQSLWDTITSGGEWHGELRNLRNDGTPLWERVSMSPVRNAAGVITNFVGFIEDITSRKALETHIQQAQKIDSVGRLAGGVAHDFNNFLTVIKGHAELAIARVCDEPLRVNLEEIIKAAKRSADLTRRLLTFARKQTVQPVILDVNATIANMLQMLERLIGENISLIWKPGQDSWTVKMDPSQIDQILANLLINARDAISGQGKVTIETENVEFDETCRNMNPDIIPGKYLMIAVSDTGSGMSKSVLENIFEPFFTTKTIDKGTGLGLATVHGIVQQNHGLLKVYSSPGEGTTFRIYLPAFISDSAVVQVVEFVAKSVNGSETILLVDDEEEVLRIDQMILERHGYKVLSAQTSPQALLLAETHAGPIHLLISDVVIPGMNGHDLSEKIRLIRPEIRVLFMSGYTANIIALRGILDQSVNFLSKPYSIKTFVEKVRDVLDRQEITPS